MYRKILIGGVTAAAIVGAGGTALAVSGTDTTSGTPASAAAKHAGGKLAGRGHLLRRFDHAQIVTHGPKGYVTHDLIKGTVQSVSSTSITVVSGDKTSETFVVNSATKVRARAGGKGSASTIAKVAKGDTVVVAGTGTSTLTAKHVVDVKK